MLKGHLEELKIKYQLIEGQPWMKTFNDLLSEYNINEKDVIHALAFANSKKERKILITLLQNKFDSNKVYNSFVDKSFRAIENSDIYYSKNLQAISPYQKELDIKYYCDESIYNNEYVFIPDNKYSLYKVSIKDIDKIWPTKENIMCDNLYIDYHNNHLPLEESLEALQIQEHNKKVPISFPLMPSSFHDIIEMSIKDDLMIKDLVIAIEKDPKMVIQVMGLANSPYYGTVKVKDITSAVVKLGLNDCLYFIMAAVLSEPFKISSSYRSMFDELWRMSLYSANFMKGLYREFPKTDKSHQEAYILGLLHNIGSFFLCTMFPKLFNNLYLNKEFNPNCSILELEKMTFNLTHQEIGAHVLESWDLDEDIVLCAKVHHEFEKCSNDHAKRMWLVDKCIARLRFGYDKSVEISEDVFEQLNIDKNDFEAYVNKFVLQIKEINVSLDLICRNSYES